MSDNAELRDSTVDTAGSKQSVSSAKIQPYSQNQLSVNREEVRTLAVGTRLKYGITR